MKKVLSILILLAIMLSLCSCGINVTLRPSGADGKDGKDGVDGKDGKDGVTPTIEISDDGYWIINGIKTSHKAIGTDGNDGKDGVDGINGEATSIDISDDGYWIINGIKTEHKAVGTNGKDGVDGANGIDGKDGITPTIDISEDGYWVINGEKSNIKATPEEVVPENPQGLDFYLQDDGTYRVSCGNAKYLTNIVIPETYKGCAVTVIDDKAFYSCTSLTSVVIPDSVIHIGVGAFTNCSSLSEVHISDITAWCSITFDSGYDNDAYIYNYYSNPMYFSGGNLYLNGELVTEIEIPDTISSINNLAFSGCKSLTSVVIPDSVTCIGERAFSSCNSLTTINFKGTIEQWNAISKSKDWYSSVLATEVICSDGTVSLK